MALNRAAKWYWLAYPAVRATAPIDNELDSRLDPALLDEPRRRRS